MRTLHEKAKKGVGFDELKKEYDSSEAEIRRFITNYYKRQHRRAKDLIELLEENTALNRGRKDCLTSTEPNNASADSNPVESVSKTDSSEATIPLSDDKVDSNSIEVDVVESKQDRLEDLRQQIKLEQDSVVELEAKRSSLLKKYQNGSDGLRKALEQIDKIKTLYMRSLEECDKALNDWTSNERNIQEHTAAIAQIQNKIDELETIVICVFANGTISLYDEEPEITLDDSGHEEVFFELIKAGRCRDLVVGDVQTIARLICIARRLKQHCEIIFDNKNLEQVFTEMLFI